jgi:hypothetical protein
LWEKHRTWAGLKWTCPPHCWPFFLPDLNTYGHPVLSNVLWTRLAVLFGWFFAFRHYSRIVINIILFDNYMLFNSCNCYCKSTTMLIRWSSTREYNN